MRLRNRPLILPDLDRSLYVPRPALEQALRRALLDERNVLLVGERRSGKTTLLHKVASDLPPGREAVTVDGSLAESPAALLRLVGRALHVVPDDDVRTFPEGADPVVLLDELDRIPKRSGAVVIVEGPVDRDVAYMVFGRLRDRLWQLPITWVATATADDVAAFRTPPADAFWSLVLDVPPMNAEEITALLERGLEPDERQVVAAASDQPIFATPGYVIRWAQDVLDGVVLNKRKRDIELQERAYEMGRPASMLMAELEALGRPVSAGDPELLGRLGWTRTNAARWLARMEEAGLLRSLIGMPQGQGRPPKLYEPAR